MNNFIINMIVSYFDLKLHLCLVIDWSDSKGVRIFSIPSEVEYARDHGVIQTGENVCSLISCNSLNLNPFSSIKSSAITQSKIIKK